MSNETTEVKKFELNEEAKVLFADLKTVLMNNIQNVQQNKEWIAQARTINKDVNSLIRLAELQLDILKFDGKQKPSQNGAIQS